jgi:hypothetical protein
MAEPGYLYVLAHPSDPQLVKVGRTVQKPEARLAQHNSDFSKIAGQIVLDTGQEWILIEVLEVPDPVHAEAAFWRAAYWHPFRGSPKVEVVCISDEALQAGLDAARKAGVRPKPKPQRDHVYAYNAWMKKRLVGRGIVLVGHVRSKFGKANFRCSNGHEWRTVPNEVAQGKGCPHCGQGERTPEEIKEMLDVGYLCLLVNPTKPGFIRLAKVRGDFEDLDYMASIFDEWAIQRYRSVEDLDLAETLILDQLGNPKIDDEGLFEMNLARADRAFRDLHYSMVRQIALAEKRMSENSEDDSSS